MGNKKARDWLLLGLSRCTVGALYLDAAAPAGNGEMTILKEMEGLDQEHDQYVQDLKSGRRSD